MGYILLQRGNEMKPINYKYWFSFDHWTFEQAAYLFINIDPNDKEHITLINNVNYKKGHAGHFNSIDTFNKNLQLIKGTDFSKYDDLNAPIGSASLTSIFRFAEEENIWGFPSRLKHEWKKSSNNSTTATTATASTEATKHPTSPFKLFHHMEHLNYGEITVSFLEGDSVELSAREVTKSLTYEVLKLRDMRIKSDISLNSAGRFLAKFLTDTPPKPDPNESKHKDKLKALIISWFGLKGDPFQLVGVAPLSRYETKFSLKNEMDRASNRIKNRSSHKNIEDIIETSNFDEENDPAAIFIKEQESR